MAEKRYGSWGWNRNDAAAAGRLLARFRLGMQPVRPAGPKASHVPGQIPLFHYPVEAARAAEEEAVSS